MIINLQGKTLKGVSLQVSERDQVINGVLDTCDITIMTPGLTLDDVCSAHRHCVVNIAQDYTSQVIAMADGTTSIASIARTLSLQHGQVRSIIDLNAPEYHRKRALHKLHQTLSIDLQILADTEHHTVIDACARHGVNVTTYRTRVRKYKEYDLWPTS